MMTDQIQYAEVYRGLHSRMAQALAFLQEQPLSEMAPGRYEVDGDELFVSIQEYNTRNEEDSFWEAHQRYIDVQYMIAGREKFKYACIDQLSVQKPYSEEHDYVVLEGDGSDIMLDEGSFIIFFPQDAHMPGLKVGQNESVKKAVVKIKV